jgi:hypothetical protein
MPTKGCSYQRVKGKCISKKRHLAKISPKRKRGCTYGRNPKSKSSPKRCYSKTEFQSKMRSLRKKSAAKTILTALKKRRSRARSRPQN